MQTLNLTNKIIIRSKKGFNVIINFKNGNSELFKNTTIINNLYNHKEPFEYQRVAIESDILKQGSTYRIETIDGIEYDL